MNKIKKMMCLSLVLLGMSSCESFLETDPKSTQTADQYYTSEVEVQNAINGIYAWLGSPFSKVQFGEAPMFMLEYPTGQGKYTVGQQSLQNPDFEKLIYWDKIYVDTWWSSSYYGIEAANMAIEAIKNLPENANLNSLLAEAYFFRAYYYFRLVRIFGDVPLKLLPTENPNDALVVKSSVKDIYEKAIIPSLLEAEKLGVLNDPLSGRISNEVIKSVLSQVYLTMAGYPLNQTDKYALAAQKSKEVIESGSFSLFQSDDQFTWFEKFRRMDYDNQGEYILMANYGNSPAPRQNYSQLLLPVGVNELTGMIQFGALMPNANFMSSFESEDLRAKEKGFIFTKYPSMNDTEKMLTFEPSIYKFFEPSLVGQGELCGKSLPLIRYAEMLLTYAEASAKSGSIDNLAIQAVNGIRQRAGLPLLSSQVTSNKDLFIDEVRKQRVFELCFEGVAFFDMVRTQEIWDFNTRKFVPLNGYVLPSGATFDVNKHCLFPIPLREIQINPDLK